MKKNIFDKMSDSYERFHLKESEIKMGNDTIYISPKLKLALGWSIFILCCVLACIFVGMPFGKKDISKEDKAAVLDEKIDVGEEHDTIIPYEKDADKELNAFIKKYFDAITGCDNETLQDMVTDPTEYDSDESLRKKAGFIMGYDNITVYTKEGLEEGSYVAFVVANLTIAGVNSSPYDIMTLYIVNGARGYLINNDSLSDEVKTYIEKIKGDEDIQKIYKSIEKKNAQLKEGDPSLQEFYDTISGKNTEANTTAGQTTENTETEQTTQEQTTQEQTTQEQATQEQTVQE